MIKIMRQIGQDKFYIPIRQENALSYALDALRKSSISAYVKYVYLYGSCARSQARYDSDVDLFLVLRDDLPISEHREELRKIKSKVMSDDIDDPEVDLKIVIGDAWETSNMLYYQNIRKEGIGVWH